MFNFERPDLACERFDNVERSWHGQSLGSLRGRSAEPDAVVVPACRMKQQRYEQRIEHEVQDEGETEYLKLKEEHENQHLED